MRHDCVDLSKVHIFRNHNCVCDFYREFLYDLKSIARCSLNSFSDNSTKRIVDCELSSVNETLVERAHDVFCGIQIFQLERNLWPPTHVIACCLFIEAAPSTLNSNNNTILVDSIRQQFIEY